MEITKKIKKEFKFTDEALVRGKQLREYVFAGNATFTVLNTESKNRFTIRVKKHKKEDLYFVSVLTGTDNVNSYTFLGTYFPKGKKYKRSNKSSIGFEAVSAKTVNWFFNTYLNNQSKFGVVEVYHEGSCGRCGRKLTTPKSVRDGFGPECVKIKNK
jgi:hypothetical protein